MKDILIAAKALIDTPDKWTKGVAALDANGKACHVKRGVCFCAGGAITRAILNDETSRALSSYNAMKPLRNQLPKPVAVHQFNDHHDTTHDDIMKLFDQAIASLS